MKNELLTIDSVVGAKQALNRALQMAVLLMYQKDAEEATVSMNISLELHPGMLDRSWTPNIKFKTNVRVPMDVKEQGAERGMTQLYWDQDEQGWMVSIEGEQMKIE